MTPTDSVPQGAPHAGVRKRLLIVEDECIVAFDLSVALEDMGYSVVATAASFDEAVLAAEEQRPDLVLMDINIAGHIDGVEAGCLLRARHQVPLVYLTANVDATTLSRALATEPAGYLVKPYNEHSLRTTIEVAFRQHGVEKALRKSHEVEREQLEKKCEQATTLARRFRREATRDPLTGLYNRRCLHHAVKREISFGQRDGHAVGLILLDLDRFKQLNDTFGHAAGDAALRAVADLLRTRLRIYDIACRYGGEEIVVVVPGASTVEAAALAEHLRAGIEGLRIGLDGAILPTLTASFGVSSFPEHGWELGTVLDAADAALYQAKAAGRNQVMVSPSRDAAASREWSPSPQAIARRVRERPDRGGRPTTEAGVTGELDILGDLDG
jgi:diguanylate cyclase (GGDEF)-like protein